MKAAVPTCPVRTLHCARDATGQRQAACGSGGQRREREALPSLRLPVGVQRMRRGAMLDVVRFDGLRLCLAAPSLRGGGGTRAQQYASGQRDHPRHHFVLRRSVDDDTNGAHNVMPGFLPSAQIYCT